MTSKRIDRRTVLRGMGAAVALPWLDVMGTAEAWGAPAATGGAGAKVPNRMAFLYVPNGKNMAEWTPKGEGPLGELPSILKPLDKLKGDFSVLTNLTADKARAHGDGGGDHARALSAFLTGCQPRKTDGTDIRAGVSVDQVAAGRIGDQTRLGSIEIGGEAGSMAGGCDSGYSCVYSSTMSWRSASQPLPKEVNPKLIFERLFGSGGDKERAERDARRKSVLDFVREDSADLKNTLGANDRRKLDEYFSSLRDVELRIAKAEKLPPVKTPDFKAPAAIPAVYEEHLRILCDLLVVAFQADVTRVATFVFANEGSNKPYPFIGVSDGHHDLSHHGKDKKKLEKIREINTFHVRQLAYLLEKLKGVKEGDGTLLDHCMVAYGSGNSDGDRHNHEELPILLAGRGCGTINPGRHIVYPKETPLNNLWLSMLDRMDVKLPNLGDSTGALPGLL
jgi:Protein of unknown function (DUF1552)